MKKILYFGAKENIDYALEPYSKESDYNGKEFSKIISTKANKRITDEEKETFHAIVVDGEWVNKTDEHFATSLETALQFAISEEMFEIEVE